MKQSQLKELNLIAQTQKNLLKKTVTKGKLHIRLHGLWVRFSQAVLWAQAPVATGYPVCCRMLSSIPGLYPLDVSHSSTQIMPSRMSLHFAKCLLETKSLLEESCSYS